MNAPWVTHFTIINLGYGLEDGTVVGTAFSLLFAGERLVLQEPEITIAGLAAIAGNTPITIEVIDGRGSALDVSILSDTECPDTMTLSQARSLAGRKRIK